MFSHYCTFHFKATKLDPVEKKLTLGSGVEISYDKCLLATRGRPKDLPVFSQASAIKEKVFKTLPDYQRLRGLMGIVGSILVCGDGPLASELSVGLAKQGMYTALTATIVGFIFKGYIVVVVVYCSVL